MSKCITSLALLYLALCSASAGALTVEEAYKAIPHGRTVFDTGSSKLPATHSGALKQLFDLSDRGTVLRVEGLQALGAASHVAIKNVLSGYRALTQSLASLQTPEEIKPAQDLVLQSIQLHQHFFEVKLHAMESSGKADLGFTQDVSQSSRKLQAAYGELMKSFPNEPAVNRQAFYDYLCALDFQ